MMRGMLNAMRLQSMLEGEGRARTVLAVVESYDSGNYCAKVRIQPENKLTGWMPVASPWIGNGWGMFAPPSSGDVVQVTFQEDDIDAGIIGMRLFDNAHRPANVPSGEFWLVHASGSLLKFGNDGSVQLTSAQNLTATVGGNLSATVTGNATIQAATAAIRAASITLGNAGTTLKKLVNEAFITLFNAHVHSNGNGGANTGAPTASAGASQTTSVTTAE